MNSQMILKDYTYLKSLSVVVTTDPPPLTKFIKVIDLRPPCAK